MCIFQSSVDDKAGQFEETSAKVVHFNGEIRFGMYITCDINSSDGFIDVLTVIYYKM